MSEDGKGGVSRLLLIVVMLAGLVAALWLIGEPFMSSLLAEPPADPPQEMGGYRPPLVE